MTRKIFLLFSLVAFFALNDARASGPETASMDWETALAAALKENPEIRAFEGELDAGAEDIGIARSRLFPRVTFEERFMRTTNPTFAFSSKLNQERFTSEDFAISSLNSPAPINDFQSSITFEQPIFLRQAYVGLKMAKTEHRAKLEEFTRTKEAVAFSLFRAALDTNTAREFVSVSEKGVQDAKEHLRIARLRYDSELGLYSDVLRAQTGVTGAEQMLVTANKNLSVAKRAIGLLLGRDSAVEIEGPLPPLALRELPYYKKAAMGREDIKSMALRYENARNNVKLAKAGYFPTMGVGGSYFLNDPSTPFGSEGESWQVAAFLRWNIFDGTQRSHEAKKARHQARKAEAHLTGLRKSVSFNIYEAYLAVQEAGQNTALAAAALETAREGERLVRLRYENSLSPIVDLLDAQLSLQRARADHVMRKNEYLFAIARLGFESGTLLNDLAAAP